MNGPVRPGAAEAALVPGDDPVLRGQRGHLRGEHGVVHQVAVAEDDRGAVAAAVGVGERDAVHGCSSHGGKLPAAPDRPCCRTNEVPAAGPALRCEAAGLGLHGTGWLELLRSHRSAVAQRVGDAAAR